MIATGLEWIGRNVREAIAHLGFATRSLFVLLGHSFVALRRPRLIIEQVHFIGNYSMVIIVVSGLFVGNWLTVLTHRLPRMMEREWQAQCLDAIGKPRPADRYGLL